MLKFNIPNHEKDLYEVETLLNKTSTNLKVLEAKEIELEDEQKEQLLKLVTNLLYKVGDLSIPIFELREMMENTYFEQYKQSPALGKELYMKHYESIHRPYDKLKNKAFRLIQILDPYNDGFEEEDFD